MRATSLAIFALALTCGCTCEGLRQRQGVGGRQAGTGEHHESTQASLLFRVEHNVVVLQRGLAGVKLRGAPRVVFRRDDHDESFLASSAVEAGELTRHLASMRGASLEFSGEGMPSCVGQVTELAAHAWAMPRSPSQAATWDDVSDTELASDLFKSGELLLVGVVEAKDCELQKASWATPIGNQLQVLSAQEIARSDLLPSLQGLSNLEYMRNSQGAFESFVAVEHRPKGSPTQSLPKSWLDLPGATLAWSFDHKFLMSNVVVQISRAITAEQLGRSNEPDKPWFERTILTVWRANNHENRLEFIGPEKAVLTSGCAGNPQCEYVYGSSEKCSSLGAVFVNEQPPLLTFVTHQRKGALRLVSNRYVLDEELTIGPRM